MRPEGIPLVLKTKGQFCVWRRERKTKVPYNPRTGEKAAVDDPTTFDSFTTASLAYLKGKFNGLGVLIAGGLGAIDIDDCIRDDNTLNDVAVDILSIFKGSYFEKSPSGKGLRGFFLLPEDYVFDSVSYYNKRKELEIYTCRRFVTVTGNVYRDGEIIEASSALSNALEKFMKRRANSQSDEREHVSYLDDDEVIEKASRSNAKFKDLYEGRWEFLYSSQSEADMALAVMLAFWCGGVEEQMDRLFRQSGLMRPDKWDSLRGGRTYGELTIRNAVGFCSKFYTKETLAPDYEYMRRTIEDLQPQSNPRYSSDLQIGLRALFVDYYRDILCVLHERGAWCVYDGKVWRPDPHCYAVSEMAVKFYKQLKAYAETITQADTRERFMKRVLWLESRPHRDSLIKDAISDSALQISMSEFDKDPYLFNCANGTLDIRTRKLGKHDPADYLMKLSPVEYEPTATSADFTKFIDEVMEPDKREYLQKILAYGLSGDTRYECMFVFYGATTRNGKGTLMEVFLRALGDYGRTAMPTILSSKKYANSSGPSEDLARLSGARVVSVSEPGKDMQLDASLAKQMTGNNIITARFLHESSFEFRAGFKLFIDTNHLPAISDTTLFDSDRIRIITFNRHFSEEERDLDLKARLTTPENLSGFLNWVLDGFKKFQRDGLKMPASVKEATNEYRTQSDKVLLFTTQCLKREQGSELKTSTVYSRFQSWCLDNGLGAVSSREFNRRLGLLGYEVQRRRAKSDGVPTTLINNVCFIGL